MEHEDDAKMKALRMWGRQMRDKNLGNHHLGSRGYPGVQEKWAKEDAELEDQKKPNPYDKYHDPKAKNYIRSRYYFDKKGNLVTTKKVQDLEKTLLVRNLITSLLSFSNQVLAAILTGSLASPRQNKNLRPEHPPRRQRRPSLGTSLL